MTIQRIDSHIEDRARLVFVFPGPKTDEKRILPFFENVTVSESKTANLVKYNPIGRSSNSFGYTGANSRKLALSFNMTLPNIESIATANLSNNLAYRSKSVEELQKSFFPDFTGNEKNPVDGFKSIKYEQKWLDVLGVDEQTEEYQLLAFKARTESSPLLGVQQHGALTDFEGGGQVLTQEWSEGVKLKYRLIDTIVFWANLIRASVLNNSTNPFYGPPIVRLTYGVLYQDIPCVCSSYRIAVDDKAGYDQRTMLPRVIGVSMDLLEVREGSRGKYQPGVAIERDNITGWETVINGVQSTDPMAITERGIVGNYQGPTDTVPPGPG